MALCPATQALFGLTLHHLDQYSPALRPAAARLWPMGSDIGILAVAAGSPARQAGLRVGDRILSIGGIAPPRAVEAGARVSGAVDFLANAAGPVRLLVGTGESIRDVSIAPVRGCLSRVRLQPARKARAWSDGRQVILTLPLLAFTSSDDELAFVIGHEIAHNALGHRGSGRRRAKELEADALALRLMARAGYEPAHVPAFVERLYDGPAGGIFASIGHVGRRDRLRAIRNEMSTRAAW